MFMLSMGPGMDLGFPDVCKTPMPPVGEPVPIPYPDIAMTPTSEPMAENVLVDCTPALNMMSKGLVSAGDDAGVELGLITEEISGETEYIVGCFTIFVDGVPAQRLTSVTGQNGNGALPNSPGMCICPSQVTVLTLG